MNRWYHTRFGYKNFVIYSDNGYPYFIDPYCGAKYGGGKASKNYTARSVIEKDIKCKERGVM